MSEVRTVRIGTGAGFAGDRIAPAVDLAKRGALDFLVFECLAERTIALAQQARLHDPSGGFDRLLERRLRAVLPACHANGTRIVTNMGAANPRAAARRAADVARDLGLRGLRVAAVLGDDVLDRTGDIALDELGATVRELGDRVISANAYTGIRGIVAALDAGADVVVCGRVADPALFVAPLVQTHRWAMDDWDRLGKGTLIGHLLECAAQVTGGYFADPGRKDVPNLAEIGFPIAEVGADGNAVVSKLEGTGGQVTRATCIEQLLYEVHDPAAYMQPDVIADFSQVQFERIGPDRVRVTGGTGRRAPAMLKVSVGYRDGWIGEGQISYAGSGCVARGRLAADLVTARLGPLGDDVLERRSDLIGYDAVSRAVRDPRPDPPEIRMRFAARCRTRAGAHRVAEEVEGLYLCGPSGGGGFTGRTQEVVAIASGYIAAPDVCQTHEMTET
ncbi:acyclic terpene utilization AtuA family protein [Jannaschia sp. LMIT008]|uniref:acyclic terpene utilization AtuA family protein n=1 Tax=Jannaschia maritima TaxID=3032585 RepID=UPI0028115BEA|nr:acyclic terpene utilization AtuA family protein [Jannaschia sp. LMIT008]